MFPLLSNFFPVFFQNQEEGKVQSWSKYLFMADSGSEGASPMSGTKGYSRHQPNNNRCLLVSLFRVQCQMGKEKSQRCLLGWTGRCPLLFPSKVLGVFKLALGLQTCSPFLLAMCTSRMPWALPLFKNSCYFWQVRTRVSVYWSCGENP